MIRERLETPFALSVGVRSAPESKGALGCKGVRVLIAWLKLRHRTLGPILDACGWAVNGRVKINLPLGTALTDRAVLPPGARRVLEDPYADEGAKRRRRVFWLVVLLLAVALGAARYLGAWPFGPPFWRR